MRSTLLIIALGAGLSACNAPDMPRQGLSAVHVPVVSTTNYVFDAAAPGGSLAPGEAARLDSWFRALNVHYGDTVFVDALDGGPARAQVADVAGSYGLLLTPGAPITAGQVLPGTVRVVISRNMASVPGCPDWSSPSQPNWNNQSPSNFGCGVNANLAAMVANPDDLVHGRAAASAEDAATAAKAIRMYREWPLTGVAEGQAKRPLKAVEATTSKDK